MIKFTIFLIYKISLKINKITAESAPKVVIKATRVFPVRIEKMEMIPTDHIKIIKT